MLEHKTNNETQGFAKFGFVIFTLFSATTSFLFLYEYGPALYGNLVHQIFSEGLGMLSPYSADIISRLLGGLSSLAFVEYSMLYWRRLRLAHAGNDEQIAIAVKMDSQMGFIAIAMSVVYMSLQLGEYFIGDLDAFVRAAPYVGFAGVIAVIYSAALNFVNVQKYVRLSNEFGMRADILDKMNSMAQDTIAQALDGIEGMRGQLVEQAQAQLQATLVDEIQTYLKRGSKAGVKPVQTVIEAVPPRPQSSGRPGAPRYESIEMDGMDEPFSDGDVPNAIIGGAASRLSQQDRRDEIRGAADRLEEIFVPDEGGNGNSHRPMSGYPPLK